MRKYIIDHKDIYKIQNSSENLMEFLENQRYIDFEGTKSEILDDEKFVNIGIVRKDKFYEISNYAYIKQDNIWYLLILDTNEKISFIENEIFIIAYAI